MAEYGHAWLHPCLVSDQQTVQKNTQKADSKQVRAGQVLVSFREKTSWNKKNTQHTEVGSVCTGSCVCVYGGKETEVWPGNKFMKPSLPNAAIFKQQIPEKMR